MMVNESYCRYSWVVVASVFTIGFITDGLVFTSGILVVELLKQFEEERGKTVLITSVMLGTQHIIGPLSGALCDKYGHMLVVVVGTILACTGFVVSVFANGILYLTFTYGFFSGFGFGLLYPPGNICELQHFDKHRSLALGLAACGSGLGGFGLSRLRRFLIDQYGWRGTILLEAGVVMHCVVCGLFLKPPDFGHSPGKNKYRERSERYSVTSEENCLDNLNEKNRDDTNEIELRSQQSSPVADENLSLDENNKSRVIALSAIRTSLLNWSILADIRCWLFLLSASSFELAFVIPFTFLPDQCKEYRLTQDEITWLISSIGISNTVSRVFVGWLGDLKFINRMVLLEVTVLLAGISTGLSFLLKTFKLKLVYTCVYGFLVGGYITLCPVVLTDIFGTKLIPRTYGLLMLSVGIADIISAPFGGWLYDKTNSYDVTFAVAGAEFLLSGFFLFVLHVLLKRKRQ